MKSSLQKSQYIFKPLRLEYKQCQSFRREKSQEKYNELKSSFQKSNESFYQQKQKMPRNQKIEDKGIMALSLDRNINKTKNLKHISKIKLDLRDLEKVSENDEENQKCGSENSKMLRNGSRSLSVGGSRDSRSREERLEELNSNDGMVSKSDRELVRKGTLKRSAGVKLLKIYIHEKNMKLPDKNQEMIYSDLKQESSEDEQKKFFTLKNETTELSPESKKINENWRSHYEKQQSISGYSQSLNSSTKVISGRAKFDLLNNKGLVESKMIEDLYSRGEEESNKRSVKEKKMGASLAMMKNKSQSRVMLDKNFSMFEAKKEVKQLKSLNTPRVNKGQISRNLYQPASMGIRIRNLPDLGGDLIDLHKKESGKISLMSSKERRDPAKNLTKNSKKRIKDKMSGVDIRAAFIKKSKAGKRNFEFLRPRGKNTHLEQGRRLNQTELKRAVLKDQQDTREKVNQIVRNIREKKNQKIEYQRMNHHRYESGETSVNKTTISTRPAFETRFTKILEKGIRPTSLNTVSNNLIFGGNETLAKVRREQERTGGKAKPKKKKMKNSMKKDSQLKGYSQREILELRDFRKGGKLKSREEYEAKKRIRKAKKHLVNDYSDERDKHHSIQKVFPGVNQKFNNMVNIIDEKMDKKMTQFVNKQNIWREKMIKNFDPLSRLKKSSGMRPAKSRKRLMTKPIMKIIANKMKTSFMNMNKTEVKLTTNSKDEDSVTKKRSSNNGAISKVVKKSNKKEVRPNNKKLSKVKSKMRLDRMLKNKNKTKVNLYDQFKDLKKIVDEEQIDKEKDIREDKQKYLKNFDILQYLGKGSYAEVHMAYDKSTTSLLTIIFHLLY